MCGIAGFFTNKFGPEELRTMTHALKHRGPDAEGFYNSEQDGLGLGHRRLSIIDLSEAANQPFFSVDRRYVMVFNGELYNYLDLAEKYNITMRTHSDSEVIIELFARLGVACFREFNGMFALAIWDTLDKKLFLVRDRFGVKPLLFQNVDGGIAFASELKALMKLPVAKKLNMQALTDYLLLEYVPGPQTILEGIEKLDPGHYLECTTSGYRKYPYYDLFEKVLSRPLEDKGESRVTEELEDLLMSSIRYRQISDVPIGAFLSGGTDSSLICALFQKQNVTPVNTFTIGFDVEGFDESPFASQVAAILKTNHSETRLTEANSKSIADRVTEFYDEPFAAPSTIPSYLVCNVARKNVTVAMSGDGGDELFMGYGYYGLYKKLARMYRLDPGVGRMLISKLFNFGGERYKRAARLFDLPSKDLFLHLWSEQQYMFSGKEVASLLSVKKVNSVLTEQWHKVDSLKLSEYEKISLFDINQYLAHNLLYKMDAASMANSLEVRNPFLDYRLVEYAFNLPEHYKHRDGKQKYILKKILGKYLPDDLVNRTKWGFPAPVGTWLQGDLSYLIKKWLDPGLISRQGVFNPRAVSALRKSFEEGRHFHYKRVWALIVFQMWYDRYFLGNEG